MESLIKKVDVYANNPKKSSTTKIGEHVPDGYQCQQFGHLIIQKINILYIVEKIIRKRFVEPEKYN